MSKSLQLVISNNQILVSSRTIADGFEKRHDNVMQAITNIECPEGEPEWGLLNFQESEYLDSQGKIQREILMTEEGAQALALGFTGKKAASFRVQLLREFKAMASKLNRQVLPTNPLDILRLVFAAVDSQDKKLALIENTQAECGLTTPQIARLKKVVNARCKELRLPVRFEGKLQKSLKEKFLPGIPHNTVTFKDIQQKDFEAATQFISEWTTPT